MPVTPSSPLSKAAHKLRRMVASSAEFQRQTGSPSTAQALQRVAAKNILGEQSRPHAIISAGDSLRWGLAGGGSFNHLRPQGALALYLARDTPPRYHADQVQAEYDAMNFFGAVLQQTADLSAKDDHLAITAIDVVDWGENDDSHWEAMGRFYFLMAMVSWGDGSF